MTHYYSSSSSSTTTTSRSPFLCLPAELHLLITAQLAPTDQAALLRAHRRFSFLTPSLFSFGAHATRAPAHAVFPSASFSAFPAHQRTKTWVRAPAPLPSPLHPGGAYTPLHWCAKHNSAAGARRLLEFGARVDCRDSGGWTPLLYAADAGAVGVLRVLLEWRADVLARDSGGRDALCWAVLAGPPAGSGGEAEAERERERERERRILEVVHTLLVAGADVNAADDRERQTAVHAAVVQRRPEVLRALLSPPSSGWGCSPVNLCAQDYKGMTALHVAAAEGNEEMVRLLLEACEKKKDKKKRGMLALEMKDYQDWTPLLHALLRGSEAVVRVLLENGADADVRDRAGRSAKELARVSRRGASMASLLEAAATRPGLARGSGR